MAERLKNIFFTRDSLESLAGTVKKYYPAFDPDNFLRLVFSPGFDSLELTKKMRRTTECLHKMLPASYLEAVKILKKCAPEVKGFEGLSLPDYAAQYGIDHWDTSLDALYHFTKYSTSELAIRPFINKKPQKVMALMSIWAEDKDPKVRRFASEGCRPRLPWAVAIPGFKKDPTPVLEVLEKLKHDDSEDVRRSVANNLNDISKDNPGVTISVCKRWKGLSGNTDRLIKHACRSLLKAGNKEAMLLFGYGNPGKISVEDLRLNSSTIKIGDTLRFSFGLGVKEKSKIRLEYAIYYVKARGQLTRKVFMITENVFEPGVHDISRQQLFADMTTRKHYPGEHQIAFIVNGQEKCRMPFEIKK